MFQNFRLLTSKLNDNSSSQNNFSRKSINNMSNRKAIVRTDKSVRFHSTSNNINQRRVTGANSSNNEYDNDDDGDYDGDKKMRANIRNSKQIARSNQQSKRQQKQKRRLNTNNDDDDMDDNDELDNDIDNEYDNNNLTYKRDDENDNDIDTTPILPGSVITEHSTILNLKRKRRLKRDGIDVTDTIDNDDHTNDDSKKSTSLLYEGIAVEPFNMNNEQNDGTGYFDGDTYVFRRENNNNDGGEPDAWLDEITNEQENNQSSTNNNNDTDSDTDTDTTRNETTSKKKQQTNKRQQQEFNLDSDNESINNYNNNNENKKKQRIVSSNNYDNWSIEKLYSSILPLLLNNNETVLQAIVRYGNVLKQNRRSKSSIAITDKNTKNNNNTTTDDKEQNTASTDIGMTNTTNETNGNNNDSMAKISFDLITDLSNTLLLKGIVEIYQKSKNDLQKLVPVQAQAPDQGNDNRINDYNTAIAFATAIVENVSNQQQQQHSTTNVSNSTTGLSVNNMSTSSSNNNNNNNNNSTVQWIYHGSKDQQIHGPYTTQQMIGWISAGYFVGPAAVYVRTVQYTSNTINSTDTKSDIQQQNNEISIQDDLLSDLLDDNDDTIETDYNNNTTTTTTSENSNTTNTSGIEKEAVAAAAAAATTTTSPTPIYGDWILSDKVDFTKYV